MKKLIIGNWKMNGNISLVDAFTDSIHHENVVIGLPSIFIAYTHLKNMKLKIAGQDCSIYKENGAHTGEISANMLKESGAEYVIIGHSERRATSAFDSIPNILKKLNNAIDSGLIPVLCVDENYETLLDDETKKILKENKDNVILAYEPLSAIGTGIVPTCEEIQNVIATIKEKFFGIKTLYGGSVNSKNSKDILDIESLDGVLIGGASLKLSELKEIIG